MSEKRLDDMSDDEFACVAENLLMAGRSACCSAQVGLRHGPAFFCAACLKDCDVTVEGVRVIRRESQH